jgi:hypothetical protein
VWEGGGAVGFGFGALVRLGIRLMRLVSIFCFWMGLADGDVMCGDGCVLCVDLKARGGDL